MLGVKLGGDVTPAWYLPVSVFAVVLGVLTFVFGLVWAVVATARARQRDRERRAADNIEGAIPPASRRRHTEPLPPASGRHWFPRGGGS
jgi:uncharacterized membrane protein